MPMLIRSSWKIWNHTCKTHILPDKYIIYQHDRHVKSIIDWYSTFFPYFWYSSISFSAIWLSCKSLVRLRSHRFSDGSNWLVTKIWIGIWSPSVLFQLMFRFKWKILRLISQFNLYSCNESRMPLNRLFLLLHSEPPFSVVSGDSLFSETPA